MRDAAVVVEEHWHVQVHQIGIKYVRNLAPTPQRLVEIGGTHPALWRAELLEQPRRNEDPCAHTPVLAEL